MKTRLFARISAVALWLWFLFAVTGLSLGNAILAVRDYDLMTFIWFVFYTLTVALFFWKERPGKYVLAGFMFVWLAMQGLNFFASPNGIMAYNKLFEGSHYIMPVSEKYLVPNTYHIVLQFLIACTLVACLLFIVRTKRNKSAA